jgi:hypothetical protein
MCNNCWDEQHGMDSYLYKNMDNCIKTLTWDKPLPKDHQEPVPTIIQNIVINNTNHNTSNLIPTTNTTNNTTNNITTNNVTKIIDPDGIIDPLSADYQRVLKRANKLRIEREKEERERRKLELLKSKEELKKRLYQAQLEEIKKLDEEVEKERQACIVREKEEAEKKKREQEAYEQKIKFQAIENKKVNQKLKEKKLDEIIMIEKEFNVSFGDIKDYKHKLYNIPQPEENMKKYNNGMMNFQICCGCGVYKAYPNQFVNTHGILHEDKCRLLCTECIQTKSQKSMDSRAVKLIECSCGIKYYGATFEARHKHETSPRHIKALSRNKLINGKKYSVLQLRKICNANVNPNETLKVANFSRMSKEDILKALLEIEDLVIPAGL